VNWFANWPRPRRLHWLLLISALVGAADRLTKTWVVAHIRLGSAIPIIPRVLRITHVANHGASFSFFADSTDPQLVQWILIGLLSLAVLGILAGMVRLGGEVTRASVALALILGGTLGNLHDHIVYGSVVDFIEVQAFSYHWPDFNLADIANVACLCLLLLDAMTKMAIAQPHSMEAAQ
jgi:signal peptidase II